MISIDMNNQVILDGEVTGIFVFQVAGRTIVKDKHNQLITMPYTRYLLADVLAGENTVSLFEIDIRHYITKYQAVAEALAAGKLPLFRDQKINEDDQTIHH